MTHRITHFGPNLKTGLVSGSFMVLIKRQYNETSYFLIPSLYLPFQKSKKIETCHNWLLIH